MTTNVKLFGITRGDLTWLALVWGVSTLCGLSLAWAVVIFAAIDALCVICRMILTIGRKSRTRDVVESADTTSDISDSEPDQGVDSGV